MLLKDFLGEPLEEPEWSEHSVNNHWFSFFYGCLSAGVEDAKLNSPEIWELQKEIYQASVPFQSFTNKDRLPEEPPSLEVLSYAVQLCEMGTGLEPQEFQAYRKRGCKGQLSYLEAKQGIERFFAPMLFDESSKQELQTRLEYLQDLRRLRFVVKTLYKKLDPYFVVNGKPLSMYYQDFRDHYAFETVFGFTKY